jgi:hypothetical protein
VPCRCRPNRRTVGVYLANLTDCAPTTISRRLAALGKMYRVSDLPWNPSHRDMRGPLEGLLRVQRRPIAKTAPLVLGGDIMRKSCESAPSRGPRAEEA